MQRQRLLGLAGLFLLGLAIRLPTLGLPLQGESAVLASVAAQLAGGEGAALAGHAPGLPFLTSLVVACGMPATLALRFTVLLLASSLAPVLVLLLRRFELPAAVRWGAGVLFAIHPLALWEAGGLHPGSAVLGALGVLLTLVCVSSPSAGARRLGGVLAVLLPLLDAGTLWCLPGCVWLYARRESAPRIQTALVLLAFVSALAAPFLWLDVGRAPRIGPGTGALWLMLATVLTLLPALPAGLRRVWDAGPAARVFLVGSLLATLAPLAGAPGLSLLGLAALVGAGAAGFTARYATRARPVALATVGVLFALSLWSVWGGARPGPAQAARGAGPLRQLRAAVDAASDAAGDGGWIVLAVAEDEPATQASLADLAPGRFTWRHRAGEAAQPGSLRQLHVFPAASFEAGRSVTVIAPAGAASGIETFGGAGIFQQELLHQIGPYVVLRAHRP